MLTLLIERLPIGWAARFALLRLLSQWRTSMTILVGVLLAATIGANAPLYAAAIAQIGMIQRVNQQPIETMHLYNRITLRPVANYPLAATWDNFDAGYRQIVETRLGGELAPWLDQVVTGAEASPMPVMVGETPLEGIELRLAYYEQWTDKVDLIAGAFPVDTTEADVAGVLSISAANLLNIQVGDVITLARAQWVNSRPVQVLVTGLVEKTKPDERYWIASDPLRLDRLANSEIEANLLLHEADFNRIVTEFLPDTGVQLHWRVLLEYEQLRVDQIPQVQTALTEFQKDTATLFDPPDFPSLSPVETNQAAPVLVDYQEESRTIAVPITLLILQIGALVLLFLMVIVALVRQGERREIAMLQSRGAYHRQIYLVRGLEALVICVIATLVAPHLAKQLLNVLAPLLADVDSLPLQITRRAYAASGLAAVGAFMMLLLTLRPVLNLPLISAGGSALRGETQAWWQRYYLDLVLMLLGLVGLWRMLAANSTLIEVDGSTRRADPLLLLTPTLLFMALGSVLLRLFPIVMSILARFFSQLKGLGGALAAWQVSREPLHYGRITFLLALAVGVGWFATSFQATINRSQQDRSHYQVGADMRLSEQDVATGQTRLRPLADYLAVPGVEAAVPVLRLADTSVDVEGLSIGGGDILAVSQEHDLREIISWRDDLGALPAPVVSDPIDLAEIGQVLPAETAKVGLWLYAATEPFPPTPENDLVANPLFLMTNLNAWVRLIDSAGNDYFVGLLIQTVEGYTFPEGEFSFDQMMAALESATGWIYYEADLTTLENPPQGDLYLTGIFFNNNDQGFVNNQTFQVYFDQLTLTSQSGEIAQPDWLLNLDRWTMTETAPSNRLTQTLAPAPGRDSQAMQLQWENRLVWVGTLLNYPPLGAIPAVVSPSFLKKNNLIEGINFTLPIDGARLPFHIQATSEFYPTLYNEERPFIVIDLDGLQYMQRRMFGEIVQPNEIWLRLAEGADQDEVIMALEAQDSGTLIVEQHNVQATLAQMEADPLSVGLIGLLFISFLMVLALSIISLLIYITLNTQFRRAEYGVLRALGVSSTRLISSLALELVLITSVAVLLGAIMGLFLSGQVLPTLATTISTTTVTPPFDVQIEIGALLRYGAAMLSVLVLVLISSLLLVRRLSLSQALRLTEE